MAERLKTDEREITRQDREKALEAAIKQIEREYGQGAVMKLGDAQQKMNVQTISTGSLSLDMALGVGGVPRGRIIEIYGPESSGKTTIALHVIAEAQKQGGICGFIDAEHALDPTYAKNIGVDIDNLYISQPDSGEQALEICDTMVRSGAIDVIIVDSVAALVPKKELEGEMGDSVVGLQARLMSQALRKLTAQISKSNCVVIFINQLREKVGVQSGDHYRRKGPQVLFLRKDGSKEVRRQHKAGQRHRRKPCQDQDIKEQGGTSLQDSGAGYDVRKRHIQGGGPSGCGCKRGYRGKERCMVCL